MTLFSSVEIEVLLHHYCSPNPYPDHNNPSVIDAITKFRNDGIFTKQVKPELTEKGRAWLITLLNTPYPRAVFIDQQGNIINS